MPAVISIARDPVRGGVGGETCLRERGVGAVAGSRAAAAAADVRRIQVPAHPVRPPSARIVRHGVLRAANEGAHGAAIDMEPMELVNATERFAGWLVNQK